MTKKEEKYSWENISGEDYFEICNILYDKDFNDEEKEIKLISYIENISEDDVLNLSLYDYAIKKNKLSFLNRFDFPKIENLKSLIIDGIKHIVINDISKITYGQFMDYQVLIKKPLNEVFDKILSIFIIPEGKNYNEGYDIINLQDKIRKLSFPTIQGLLYFFLKKSLLSSLKEMKTYL